LYLSQRKTAIKLEPKKSVRERGKSITKDVLHAMQNTRENSNPEHVGFGKFSSDFGILNSD